MAGDWMKMRTNLWDDPRVGCVVELTDTSEATVIGGLYWLWAMADQHTEDGWLPGMSARQIDRKSGIPGFAQALASIGWIELHEDGALIARFDEHNGKSAKKRCQTAQRVAKHKAGNAAETHCGDLGNAGSVSDCEGERYLEKRREDPSTPEGLLRAEESLRVRSPADQRDEHSIPPQSPAPLDPTAAGRACLAMRRGGLLQTNPGDPRLAAAIAEGATDVMWQTTAAEACSHDPPRGVAWVIATVRGRIADAARQPNTGAANGAHRNQPRLSAVDRVVANIQRARQLDQWRGDDGDDDDDAIPGEAVRIPR